MVRKLTFGSIGLVLAAALVALLLVVSGGGPNTPPAQSAPVVVVGEEGGWFKVTCADDAQESSCRAALDSAVVEANGLLGRRAGG